MPILELGQPGVSDGAAGLLRAPAVSNRADTAIRASTAAVVLAVAGIAAYISYWHAYAVVRQYGENGVTALLEPGTTGGLVYASSMVILHAARHRLSVPRLARAMLAPGIAASLAVNVAQGWSHGLAGAAAAAWPAIALVGSYELPARMIRTAPGGGPDPCVPQTDPCVPQADQPQTVQPPAVSPPREAAAAPASGDGAGQEPGRVHDWFHATRAAAPDHGPESGEPARTDQADHEGRPTVPGPVIATAPAGDINAAAIAAYRASIGEGKPLSERKLAASFGKTSRRWARARMAEARQRPVAG